MQVIVGNKVTEKFEGFYTILKQFLVSNMVISFEFQILGKIKLSVLSSVVCNILESKSKKQFTYNTNCPPPHTNIRKILTL